MKAFNLHILLIILTLASCAGNERDQKLLEIADIVAKHPTEALAALDSIDRDTLSLSNAMFYDLLTIKGHDKSYDCHTTDSLILNVIDYYDRHRNEGLYPEALYYGGRVYSDMGDYPTALQYFQDALDLLPPDTGNIDLRGNVLSQTGRLLNSLGLYHKAVPYLEKAINIDIIRKDTFCIAYDNQLLGAIHLHLNNFDIAKRKFEEASSWASNLKPHDRALMQMYKATTEYHIGNIDTAVKLIRPVPSLIDSVSRNAVLAYAVNIYMKAELFDTARIYAHELTLSKDPNNRVIGYKALLSPQLKKYLDNDSLGIILNGYHDALEYQYISQDSQDALIQNSRYNYQIHQRERNKAENLNNLYNNIIIGGIITILILIVAILYLIIINKNKVIQLHNTLDDLEMLKASIDNDKNAIPTINIDAENQESHINDKDSVSFEKKETILKSHCRNEQQLRNELRTKLLKINETYDKKIVTIPTAILESDAYKNLQKHLSLNKPIPNSSDIWNELENLITTHSKEFKYRLQLLTGGINHDEFQLAILIKLGMTPSQTASLIGRSKSTISYRRKGLCIRVLGKDEQDIIDSIIRIL